MSAPCFRLAEDHSEVTATKSKALFDAPNHSNPIAIAGDAIILAVNPHAASAVVDLEDTVAQRTKGFRYSTANAYVFTGKAAWIAIDISDAGFGGTSGQQHDSRGQGKHEYQLAGFVQHQKSSR